MNTEYWYNKKKEYDDNMDRLIKSETKGIFKVSYQISNPEKDSEGHKLSFQLDRSSGFGLFQGQKCILLNSNTLHSSKSKFSFDFFENFETSVMFENKVQRVILKVKSKAKKRYRSDEDLEFLGSKHPKYKVFEEYVDTTYINDGSFRIQLLPFDVNDEFSSVNIDDLISSLINHKPENNFRQSSWF